METATIIVFVAGYLAIMLEHPLRVNKAASALLTGTLCWTVYVLGQPDKALVIHQLGEQLSDISAILFFLLGAMTVVELIDAHDGFELVTDRIRTTDRRRLLWLIGGSTFFLSAVLDNLTTTIVLVSLLRKLIARREERLLFVGLVVIAANAGGAWSPIGDVTTTMLWMGNQISPLNITRELLLPSLVCLLVPLILLHFRLRGHIQAPDALQEDARLTSTPLERKAVLGIGIGVLLFVPVFKMATHLPPYMGMLLGLGLIWLLTEMIHSGKDEAEKGELSVVHALRKVDAASILFFLGILLAVSALQSMGTLAQLAGWLDRTVGNITVVGISIGFLSAVVDNVPLVAAAQGMYTLEQYPTDHFFWELLAYCAGTGGSALIIGSAAGVAAMGMERIDFLWYLRHVSWLAVLGYLAGALVYVVQYQIFG